MQAVEMVQKLYRKALPTDTDTRRLVDQFKSSDSGRFISHEDLEELLGELRNTHRYRTLISKWKQVMARDHNLELKAEVGKGYRVLDAQGRVDLSIAGFHAAKKRVTRSLVTISRTDTGNLEQQEAKRADHARLMLASTLQHMNDGIKQLPNIETGKPIHIDKRPKS